MIDCVIEPVVGLEVVGLEFLDTEFDVGSDVCVGSVILIDTFNKEVGCTVSCCTPDFCVSYLGVSCSSESCESQGFRGS